MQMALVESSIQGDKGEDVATVMGDSWASVLKALRPPRTHTHTHTLLCSSYFAVTPVAIRLDWSTVQTRPVGQRPAPLKSGFCVLGGKDAES